MIPPRSHNGKLLQVFFAVAHDPTQLNRQGPDEGTQYHSTVFYGSDKQKQVAEAYIQQLGEARAFKHQMVTQVAPLTGFYPAEKYHQNYMALHPDQPCIVYNDLPKLEHLRKQFHELYQSR